MSNLFIWPRMDRSTAEKRFLSISQISGPSPAVVTDQFDYVGIGNRLSKDDLNSLRDRLTEIARPYGFNPRRQYDAYTAADDPGQDARREFDRLMTREFYCMAPMPWSEAGSNEVWSWFALALLPDLTHWRWRFASNSQTEKWNRERWIGGDLTRHTWARYWWRAARFEGAESVLEGLKETELTQLLERGDVLGANPRLLVCLAQQLPGMYTKVPGKKAEVVRDVSKRLLRRMAYVDDVLLSEEETRRLVDGVIHESVTEFRQPSVSDR